MGKNKNRNNKVLQAAYKTETSAKGQNEISGVKTEETMNFINSFCEAIGAQNPNFFGGNNIALPGAGTGGGSIQPVEDTATLWTNLRWYLVSNMRQVLSQSFVEIGLVQTIVCVPVDDALRGGILIKSKQLDESEIKELMLSVDRDADLQTAGWAAKWERLYGGAGILVLVGDQDPAEPLDIKAIGPDTDLEFRDVDMWELFWDKQNVEGYDSQLQEHDFEFYSYYSEDVHKTRVMRLVGFKAPSFIRPRLRGWGVSVVEALIRSINQYLKATDLGFEVLDEFKIDIYKIKNLVNTLLSPVGTNQVRQTIQMMNWTKNYQNAIVMDSEDDYAQKQLSFTGLAEAMDGIRMQVAADMRIPSLKLFGQSLSGGSLSSSSQEEMENYNSMVESEVRGKLKYHILRILELKCQKLFGFIPDDLEIEFKPLRELSAIDQETVKTQKFTRLLQARQAGLISDQVWMDSCNKGNLFDVQLDTVEDGMSPDNGDENDTALEDKDPKEDGGDKTGANREDSRHVGVTEVHTKSQASKTKNANVKAYRALRNSPAFDRASYEADGGDSWIDPRRKEIFDNPLTKDEGLWAQAKSRSEAAFGKVKWQFVLWMYEKLGGKLDVA